MTCDNPNCQWRADYFNMLKQRNRLVMELAHANKRLLKLREEVERWRQRQRTG